MTEFNITDANAKADAGNAGGCGCGGCGCGGGQAEAEPRPEAKDTSDAPAGAAVAQYTVSGMTCGHCVSAVTEEVSALDGVTDVAVDLESGSLKVTSQGPIDFDRIVEAVAEAGDYTVA